MSSQPAASVIAPSRAIDPSSRRDGTNEEGNKRGVKRRKENKDCPSKIHDPLALALSLQSVELVKIDSSGSPVWTH